MGRQDKRLRKLWRGGSNVRLKDVLGALEAAGFVCKRTGDGHWLCHHRDALVSVSVAPPHGRPDEVLHAYVSAARHAIEAVWSWEDAHAGEDADR